MARYRVTQMFGCQPFTRLKRRRSRLGDCVVVRTRPDFFEPPDQVRYERLYLDHVVFGRIDPVSAAARWLARNINIEFFSLVASTPQSTTLGPDSSNARIATAFEGMVQRSIFGCSDIILNRFHSHPSGGVVAVLDGYETCSLRQSLVSPRVGR